MVLIETLKENIKDKIVSFIKEFDKQNNEFEISFFQKSDLLTLERFNNLNNVLNIVTKKNDNKHKLITNSSLDIILSYKTKKDILENYRITINGIEKINEYLQMLGTKKNELIFSTLMKIAYGKHNDDNIKIIKKVKDFNRYIIIDSYYLKIKLDEELELTKEEIKKLMDIRGNYKKGEYNIIYRLKNRNSYFIVKSKNLFRIDLTLTKQSYNINNLENSIQNSEVELECLIEDKKVALDEILSISEFIIKIVQQTNNIISEDEKQEVLKLYSNLLGINNDITNLYGRKPVSLEIVHAVDNLPNKYSLTDKADGERNMLLVYNNNCYLINNNLNVKNIGISINAIYNNSILDGEYIFVKEHNKYLYMVFDCLVISGIDYRNEVSLIKRLIASNNLINGINKINIEFKDVIFKDLNDINKVINTHKENLYLMYDDINENLKKTKNTTLVRKKYFINVFGLKDNEIFYYSDLMWNLYTLDKKLKCPYELDGLIYQPLEQKYEVETNKSKYPDLKWKPAKLNSIDFYIEFEKDKKTGKILVLYDNTLSDETDDIDEIKIEENKKYLICNLYVGNKVNNVEQPQLFSNNPNEYQCFLFLDETNNVRSSDGVIINDKTVVEFYYDLKSEIQVNMRWVPLRTRYEKTEIVNKYKKNFGNSYYVSKKVWQTILNPFTENDFKELMDDEKYEHYIRILKNKIGNSSDSLNIKGPYYNKTEFKHHPFTQFHNFVKSQLIYTYTNKYYNDTQYTVLDLGCGQGGDIQKFYYASILSYVGIDPDYDNIFAYGKSQSRYDRFRKDKKKYPNFPPMTFLQGSSTSLLTYEDQIKEIGKMNNEQKNTFNKFFGENNKTYFDRFNSSMSLHYYLKNETSWLNFCENVNKYLRSGGYFIFEVMDGEIVREKLKDKDTYQLFYDTIKGEKKLLFEIKKKYNDNSVDSYGNTIDVHMSWLSEENIFNSEYLVNFDFVVKSLKDNCNLELIESDYFKTIYDDSYEYIKSVCENERSDNHSLGNLDFISKVIKFYEDTPLNKVHKEISDLYRYYVFKKTETDLKDVKQKYYGKKSTIFTAK